MKDIKIFANQKRSKNDKFWINAGTDELFPYACSDEGRFLMKRMAASGGGFVRNHYTFNKQTRYGIRVGGDVYHEDENGNPVFSPNEKITRAEAAVMLNNMCELEVPVSKPLFTDRNSVPAWAESAVYCLAANGIMPYSNGCVAASEILNRGEGVYMLYNLALLTEKK